MLQRVLKTSICWINGVLNQLCVSVYVLLCVLNNVTMMWTCLFSVGERDGAVVPVSIKLLGVGCQIMSFHKMQKFLLYGKCVDELNKLQWTIFMGEYLSLCDRPQPYSFDTLSIHVCPPGYKEQETVGRISMYVRILNVYVRYY